MLPFKANIEGHLKLVLGLVEKNDVLLLAFSGHGVQLGQKAFLCPTEADLNAPDTLVSLDWVYEQLKYCPAAFKLLVVDACRNDPRVEGRRALTDETKGFARSLNKPPPEGIVLLSSCSPGEISMEDKEFCRRESEDAQGPWNSAGVCARRSVRRFARADGGQGILRARIGRCSRIVELRRALCPRIGPED